MGLELGRISGPLLAANLRRNEDLAFKNTDLSDPVLFLNIGARQIGINTDSTNNLLTVNGLTSTLELVVDTHLETPNFYISTNRIQNLVSAITIEPDQTTDPTVKGLRFDTVNFKFTTNAVENVTNGSDINFNPNGDGRVVFTTTQVNIDGDLHATGDITFDGSITFGNNNLDSLTFSADIASHIVPDLNETYDLGTSLKRWNSLYSKNILATSATISGNLIVNNINLSTLINKTLYVSVNGNDGNIGSHDHATYRTIKYALSQAVAGDEVVIFPGTYEEEFPLTVPQGVSVRGTSIRAVNIQPTIETNTNNAFLMNGETTVSFLTVKDFYAPGNAFSFAVNFTVSSRSPYVQNVSVITAEIPGAITPTDITVGPAPTGISFTSFSVTLSKEFYSQELVDSLVGQLAFVDRYPASPGIYSVVEIFTEPSTPGLWRMVVDTPFNSTGWLKPISFYPTTGLSFITPGDIWDTTGNSVGEKWVAYFKYNLQANFETTVGPGWTINVAGTIYIVDYIIEDPVNTNMWRIYVTTSLVAGVGIPIFSAPIVGPTLLAGKGALVDGSLANNASKEASMLFHAVTMIVPDADGITATNGARVEWINSFTYFANRGIYLTQGTAGFANLGVKFGAEFRSIDSANVYGNFGAVADGANTLGYLIGHNFGYVGSGLNSSNDRSLAIQANEVFESNNGRIYYDSMDHKGDYRIGNIFYVNQETGQVTFDAQSINYTAGGNITLEGPTSVTIIDALKVQTGNIRIYDNNIDSLSGPVNLLAQSGTTNLSTDVYITGNLDLTGNVTVGGNLFLGNTPLDTVTVFPKIGQDLNPAITNNYTLGIDGLEPAVWRAMFLSTALNVDNVIEIGSNTITTLTTDTDLELTAAGTGIINVVASDVGITNSLTVNGLLTDSNFANIDITGLLNLTGGNLYSLTGNADRTGNTDITGYLKVLGANTVQFEDINFIGNTISKLSTTGNLEFSTLTGTNLVKTLTSDVEITNDLDVGLYGYLNQVNVTTNILATDFTADNVYITGNTITTNATDVNLVLSANGTGIVHVIDSDVEISNNLTTGSLNVIGVTSLTNTVVGTTLPSTSVGSAQFSGSNYLSVAGGAGTAMGLGDLTWECWVYPTASSSYQAFIDTRTNPLGGGDTTGFYFGTNFNTLTPMYYTNGLQLASSINITLNTWNHVALTRASGTVTIWVNGASGGTRTGDTTNLSQQRVFIGSSGLDLYLTGRITNVRIVKGTAVYTSVFAVPTAPLTAITGTQLLLLEDTSANLLKDSSTNNFTVTNNGTVTWSSLSPVVGGPGGTIPATLTQTGNIIQTGNTYIEGTFGNNNVTVLNPSYLTVPNFKFEDNIIQVTAPATDLVINSFSGGVVFNRILKIADNIIGNIFDVNDIELAFNNLYLTEDNQLLLTEDGDNYLLDTNSAGDLSVRFRPSGTGKMRINSTKALAVAYGNNTNRVLGDVGEIRQNSTTGLYEGYSPNGLVSFNNIYDNDRNTYITPELTPGADDNILQFGVNSSVRATISSSVLFTSNLNVDNVSITGTTISNLISTNDLELSPVGTGYVSINDILFTSNTVAPLSDDPLILQSTGTGYFKFTGSGGLVIPVGNSSTERPVAPDLGEVRYNSTGNYTEVFNGSAWVSASGASSAATEEDIAAETNLWAFVLG